MHYADKHFEESDGFSVSDGPAIFGGDLDPSIDGCDLPEGSLYLGNTGSGWIKKGANPTDWSKLDVASITQTLQHVVAEDRWGDTTVVCTDDDIVEVTI